jgi:hypothetical protein
MTDLQPQSPTPYDDHPISAAKEIIPDEELAQYSDNAPRSGGCGITVLLLGTVALFGLIIVGLAAAAGWTSGQREASVRLTSTQSAAINAQIAHIPEDIASGNLVLLDARLRYLATITPAVSGINDYIATGTALYQTLQPTATLTPSLTPSPTMTVSPAPTADPAQITPSPTGSAYNLPALLAEAQGAYVSGNYSEAAELAEVIMAVDETYESVTVIGILTDSLNALARQYYNGGQPAAGNQIVGRIEALGLFLGDGLAYERDVAEVYLNAMSNIGISFPRAIAALEELLTYGQGRYYNEALNELVNQYIAYGDALAYDPAYGFCPAVVQYQNAYNLTGSGTAGGKLNNATTMCSQATPPIDPALLGTPGAGGTVAPLGVPGG